MTSPVLFKKHPAAANVVRPLLNVFEAMETAQRSSKRSNGEVFVRTPTSTIAVEAMNTNIEGVKVTSFIFVRRSHETIGFGKVLMEAFRLLPCFLSASQAMPVVMASVTGLDLIDSFGSVGASHWIGARHTHQLLVAFT